jgi:hypothetical protein
MKIAGVAAMLLFVSSVPVQAQRSPEIQELHAKIEALTTQVRALTQLLSRQQRSPVHMPAPIEVLEQRSRSGKSRQAERICRDLGYNAHMLYGTTSARDQPTELVCR